MTIPNNMTIPQTNCWKHRFLPFPCTLQQSEGHYLKFTKHLFASTTNLRDVSRTPHCSFGRGKIMNDTTRTDPCGIKTKGIMFFKWRTGSLSPRNYIYGSEAVYYIFWAVVYTQNIDFRRMIHQPIKLHTWSLWLMWRLLMADMKRSPTWAWTLWRIASQTTQFFNHLIIYIVDTNWTARKTNMPWKAFSTSKGSFCFYNDIIIFSRSCVFWLVVSGEQNSVEVPKG